MSWIRGLELDKNHKFYFHKFEKRLFGILLEDLVRTNPEKYGHDDLIANIKGQFEQTNLSKRKKRDKTSQPSSPTN